MSITELWENLRRGWKVILAGVLLGLAGSSAVALVSPPTYSADITMYVSTQSGSGVSPYEGSLISQQRVTSYIELLNSSSTTQRIAAELGGDLTDSDVGRSLSAEHAGDSVVFTITATRDNPDEVRELVGAVTKVLPRVIDELERPEVPGAVAPVVVRPVVPLILDVRDSSQPLSTSLAIGAIAGLIIGTLGVLALRAVDRTVRSQAALGELTQAPALGRLRRVSRSQADSLQEIIAENSEDLRRIRANLQYVSVDSRPVLIGVSSALPAEGKSVVACGLAEIYAANGANVLLIDADLRKPRIAKYLRLESSSGLTSVLSGRASMRQITQSWKGGHFDVVASGGIPPNPGELLASRQMADLLRESRHRYDIVLVDLPPLLAVADTIGVAPALDGVIILCRSGKTAGVLVKRAAEALPAAGGRVLGCILSMTSNQDGGEADRAYGYYGDDLAQNRPGPPAPPARPASRAPQESRSEGY